jgi:hypothetical protein
LALRRRTVARDHQTVHERLSNREFVEGLKDIPVTEITGEIEKVFAKPGWKRLDAENWESATGAFQAFTTPQFFRVDCYEMDGGELNRLIDSGIKFGLRLQDPQVGKRFGG